MSPLRMKRILVPTDFGAHSEKAFLYALELAKAFSSEIVLLHVFDTRVVDNIYHIHQFTRGTVRAEMQKSAEEKVRHLCAREEAKGVLITARYAEGLPPFVVKEIASKISADLIVMGTHGQTGLSQLLYGSTAEGVVHGAPCPVLTMN